MTFVNYFLTINIKKLMKETPDGFPSGVKIQIARVHMVTTKPGISQMS